MSNSVIVKNTLAQFISRVLFVVLSLLLVRLLTSFLGREGYGTYSFITALILLFGTLADWGTSTIAVREASQRKDEQGKIFGTILVVRLILSLVAIILANTMVRVYPPWHEFTTPVTIASFVLIFLSLKTTTTIIFQTMLRLDLSSLVEVVGSLSFFILTAYFLTHGGDVGVVLAGWVGATAIAAGVGWVVSRHVSKTKLQLSGGVLRRLIKEILPMGTLLLVFSIYNRVDIIILEHFHGVSTVGVYSLAYKIHENLILGAAFLMNALFPIFSNLYRDNKEQLLLFYRRAFGILALVGINVSVFFFVVAVPVVSLLTGDQFSEFTDSIVALRILLFATFFSYLNHLTGYSLVAFGKQRMSLVIGVVALTLNISANLIFIPRFSWAAAAFITGVTELLVFILSSLVVWRVIMFLPWPAHLVTTAKELVVNRGKIF